MLLLGDCLELLPTLPAGSVDMVFADLPYGVTANKWDSVIPFAPLWEQLLRVGKKNCAYVFTATQPFATALINSQPRLFRYDLIWQKNRHTGHLNVNKMPLRTHETILVFYRALPIYNPIKTEGHTARDAWNTTKTPVVSQNLGIQRKRTPYVAGEFRMPGSSIKISCDDKARVHPTQKPVALLERLVKTYSNEGDMILDPTMGSGTTGVACANTGRRFVGIEQDTTYFATATRRVAEASRG